MGFILDKLPIMLPSRVHAIYLVPSQYHPTGVAEREKETSFLPSSAIAPRALRGAFCSTITKRLLCDVAFWGRQWSFRPYGL